MTTAKQQVSLTRDLLGKWHVAALNSNGVWVPADGSRTNLTKEEAMEDMQGWIGNGCERVDDRDL